MTSPSGQTHLAIVTGVTSGIGLAMAKHLHRAGFSIYGVARNAQKLADCEVPLVGSQCCDLSELTALQACLRDVDLSAYQYAVLVNNAGSLDPIGRFESVEPQGVAQTMVLNGLAPLVVSGNFYRSLLATQGCVGRVVQLTSGAAHRPIAGWMSYCASKAAMWRGTEVIASEMDVSRCQIMALSPGVVATAMQAQIRAQSHEAMPDVDWFRDLAAQDKLASPDKPARYLVEMLLADLDGTRQFPHGESIDLFDA